MIDFSQAVFGSDLPYDQSPNLNDFARQLEYELFFCPDGFVAQVLSSWYNSLYSEWDTQGCIEGDYGVCPDAPSDDLATLLFALLEGDATTVLIDYWVERMLAFPDRNQAFDFANRQRDAINQAINLFQNG